jgi:flagellar biosynthesis/type III secretory pathway protein FliH
MTTHVNGPAFEALVRCNPHTVVIVNRTQGRYEIKAGGVTVWTEFGECDAEMAEAVAAERAS